MKAEFIWLNPEVGEGGAFGGEDGLGGYMPLAVATPDLTGAVQLTWVHGNHLGVPIAITDANGDPATTPNDYLAPGFPGQSKVLPDLYYNRYRDYDPTTGRYIQADPIGLAGGANSYSYVDGNPIGAIDPEGLAPAVVGGAIRVVGGRAVAGALGNAARGALGPAAGGVVACILVLDCAAPAPALPRPQDMSPLEERQFDRYCANSSDRCAAIKAAARQALVMAQQKMLAMRADKSGLFGTIGWISHQNDLRGRIAAIEAMISLGEKMNCDMSYERMWLMHISIPRRPD